MSRRIILVDLSYIRSVMCWPFDLDHTAGARSLLGHDSEIRSDAVLSTVINSIQVDCGFECLI